MIAITQMIYRIAVIHVCGVTEMTSQFNADTRRRRGEVCEWVTLKYRFTLIWTSCFTRCLIEVEAFLLFWWYAE